MSKGSFSLRGDVSKWIDVEIDGTTPLLDMPLRVFEKLGGDAKAAADFHAFFVPRNFNRDLFSGSAIGLGNDGGVFTW